jgi:titin
VVPVQGNVISGNQQGIWVSGMRSAQNTVAGNFIGTGPDGTNAMQNGTGVILDSGAVSNSIGGASAFARNLISGNTYQAVLISSNGTSFNIVSNNYIGIDLTGTNALANNDGVTLAGGASANSILGNLISANTSDGIVLDGAQTTNNVVQGNSVGPDSTGLKPPVTSSSAGYSPVYQGCGVKLQNDAAWNLTGGYAAGQGNLVAFNAGDGVLVYDTATHDAIVGNSIHDNGGLGINLQPLGEPNSTVTANHSGGGTSGPNELLNFPILTNTTYTPTTTLISGAITNGQPNQNFSIEFYANATNDPSGNGQGGIYLGHTSVVTDGSGNANFDFAAAGYFAQNYLAATATALSGSGSLADSTSEFGPDFFAPVAQVVITYVMQSGTNFSFGFQTYTGQSYTIQTNADLSTTNWDNFLNIFGDGTLRQFLTPKGSTPQLFFRVCEP